MKQFPLPFGLTFLRRLSFPRKLGVLEKIYGNFLLNAGVQWVKTSNGVVWKLDLSDVTHRWIIYGAYEGPVQLNWIQNWLSPGGLVVDSGANIGQMLLYMAPLKNVRIMAFEPVEESINWLKECVANYPSWNVECIALGLYNTDAVLQFQLDGGRSTIRTDWYQKKDLELIRLPVTTLDSIVPAGESIRLWKLDVEGCELEALEGAGQLLEAQRIEAILVEVCKENLTSLVDMLDNYGYHVQLLNKKGHLVQAPRELSGTTNIIALSGNVHSF